MERDPEKDGIPQKEQADVYELVEEACPQCGALFGWDEIERQICFACGWPHEEPYFDDED